MSTWILVADRARARLLSRAERFGPLAELGGYANPQGHLRPSDEGRDRPPRTQESANTARHAIEPHTDPHDKAAQAFARELAQVIERGRVEHAWEALILVAPPRFLGQLNAALGKQAAKLVERTVPKDLTHVDIAELSRLID